MGDGDNIIVKVQKKIELGKRKDICMVSNCILKYIYQINLMDGCCCSFYAVYMEGEMQLLH